MLEGLVGFREALAAQELGDGERRRMSGFDDGMLPGIDELRLLLRESAPQDENNSIAEIADDLNGRVRERLPSDFAVRISLMRPEMSNWSQNLIVISIMRSAVLLNSESGVEKENSLFGPVLQKSVGGSLESRNVRC